MVWGRVALAVALVLALASALHGFVVLTSTFGFDQGSPVPPRQREIALAGLVAVGVAVVVLVTALARYRPLAAFLLVVVVGVVGVVCAAPLWRRIHTIDVTDAGFRRAEYRGSLTDYFELYVYNAASTPIVICLSSGGVCVRATRFPARLRTPGRSVPPGDRVALKWPELLYGRFTLSITSWLPAGARRTTVISIPQPTYDSPDPFPPPQPHQPPPMPPYFPPLR